MKILIAILIIVILALAVVMIFRKKKTSQKVDIDTAIEPTNGRADIEQYENETSVLFEEITSLSSYEEKKHG